MSRWTICGALAFILVSGAAATAQDFTYFGDRGPTSWGALDPAFSTCSSGTEQSPVDLGRLTLLSQRRRSLEIHYGETDGEIFNNGHTVEVETEGLNELVLDGVLYELIQFHFHTPSEHRLEGQGSDMELHLVHRRSDGQLAVIGVLLQRGVTSGALSIVFDHLPQVVNQHEHLPSRFNPRDFLPTSLTNYQFAGSLTTPPCRESVSWVVLATPVTVSDEDMARFAAQIGFNARPVQRRLP